MTTKYEVTTVLSEETEDDGIIGSEWIEHFSIEMKSKGAAQDMMRKAVAAVKIGGEHA